VSGSQSTPLTIVRFFAATGPKKKRRPLEGGAALIEAGSFLVENIANYVLLFARTESVEPIVAIAAAQGTTHAAFTGRCAFLDIAQQVFGEIGDGLENDCGERHDAKPGFAVQEAVTKLDIHRRLQFGVE
jgi:hypothetical protein